jgi:ribose-phosphate pyrophosphokinase
VLGQPLVNVRLEHFPDSEQRVEILDSVREADVYIVQPTNEPVDSHLIELLLLVDAAKRAGAGRVTTVIPYFGYARQDRRAKGREPVTARLIAELLQASGVDRVVAVDVHTSSLEGFFHIPVELLTAVPLIVAAVQPLASPDSVIVAPDLGAVKLAERYAGLLDLPVAVIRKTRQSAQEVAVTGVVGEVAGRSPIIVDDMISTGGTIVAAVRALLTAGCTANIIVGATHGLFSGNAVEKLEDLRLRKILVTDSVPFRAYLPIPLQAVSLTEVLADAIGRLNRGESLVGLTGVS